MFPCAKCQTIKQLSMNSFELLSVDENDYLHCMQYPHFTDFLLYQLVARDRYNRYNVIFMHCNWKLVTYHHTICHSRFVMIMQISVLMNDYIFLSNEIPVWLLMFFRSEMHFNQGESPRNGDPLRWYSIDATHLPLDMIVKIAQQSNWYQMLLSKSFVSSAKFN